MARMIQLAYRDSMRVDFRDDSYRWLDAAAFTVAGPDPAPSLILRALLAHDQYVDHYMTADDVACTPEQAAELARARADARARMQRSIAEVTPEHVSGNQPTAPRRPLHGPYMLDYISETSFEQLPGEASLRLINNWLLTDVQGIPAPERLDGSLTELLELARRFAWSYRLTDLGEHAEHDYASVVEPYLELIGIDADLRTVWLVAGGRD